MAHTVEIKEIINGVQITETIDADIVVKLISYQSKPFLRTTNETDEETYQVLDIVGEIYNTPALATDFRITAKNGAVFIPANGIELIEYSKKIRAFRPDDDGFSYHIGEITGTSNSITIGLADDNVNWAYIDGSFYEKYYPDTFNFTPVNPGETKTFLIYAQADSQTFYLTQSTGIPPGTYLIASVTVSEAGIDIIQATSGFREKAVDNFAIYSLAAGDRVIGVGSNMRLKVQSYGVVRIGGFVNEEDKIYSGCPISVRNDTPFPMEFYNAVDSSPEFIAINSVDLPFSIKPGETANFAYRGGGTVEIIKTGGSASFPEGAEPGDVLTEGTEGPEWSNRLTNVETGKLDKPPTDGSWVVTKSGSIITYTDASAFGQNIANTNLTWSADRTQNLNAKKLSFTGGRVSVPALELEITAANSVPNKIWTDGADFWLTNNLGINTKITENKLVQGNFNPPTLAQIATMNLFRGDYYKHIGSGQISQFNGELLDNWYCSVAEWNALSVAQKNAVKNFNVY